MTIPVTVTIPETKRDPESSASPIDAELRANFSILDPEGITPDVILESVLGAVAGACARKAMEGRNDGGSEEPTGEQPSEPTPFDVSALPRGNHGENYLAYLGRVLPDWDPNRPEVSCLWLHANILPEPTDGESVNGYLFRIANLGWYPPRNYFPSDPTMVHSAAQGVWIPESDYTT